MSDGKDSHNSKGDPFSQLTDMESTVRIDFGANHNVASTSDGPSPIDFEQTLDGLTDIDEILNNDEIADHSDDEPTISFSTDEIDFDELDAGINALSGDFPDEEKAEDDKLGDLDSILEDESALEPTPDTDTAVMLDTFNSDKESATKATAPGKGIDDWPLLDGDDGEYEAPAEEPLVEGSGEFDLPDMTTDDGTAVDSEENAPVIELTEEMLDEPEASSHEEVVSDDSATDEALLPHEGDAIDEIIDESDQDEAPKGNFDNLSETPELTTTETNILAGATAAIHDIAEEEKKIHKSEAEKEPVGQHPVPPGPVATKGGGSSATTVPTIMALLAIAAGGFAAWMAWDATNRIAYLESQVRNLQSAKATTTNRQSIVDIQQRLVKVERRLTGTPTIEAATTLGDVTTEATTAQEPAIA
ncbi:MAG TPA: hypothetical protein VKA23_04490, partial [Mariprofundaceae bacterium]|nr:hypothetical protein [Mariprofundaceae bacterium]